MLPLRFARAWLIAGLVLLAAGLVSALLPPSSSLMPTFNDKLMHAAAFTAFMLWFGGLFTRRNLPLVALALAGYGLGIELLQGLTPTRQPEVLDLVADVAGVLLGWLLGAAGLSRWCLKLESWLASPNP